MKTIIFSLLIFLLPFFSFSQNTMEARVAVHGGWLLPNEKNDDKSKNGFTTGATCYLTLPLLKPFFLITGAGYEYKEMKTLVFDPSLPSSSPHGGYGDGYIDQSWWEKMPQHYIILPVELRLKISKALFVQGGMELGWLTNYKMKNEKTEYNWCIGFGNCKHRLSWSFKYVKGLKEQGFGKVSGNISKSAIYTNQEMRFCLSYPLWTH